MSSGLVVDESLPVVNEFLPDEVLGISYLAALKIANNHNSLMEALLVGLVLGLLQQFLIVLTLDFHLLAKGDCSQVSVGRSVDEGNGLQVYHLLSDAILLTQRFLVPQVAGSHPVIRGIAWHTGNHTSSLLHGNGHHG